MASWQDDVEDEDDDEDVDEDVEGEGSGAQQFCLKGAGLYCRTLSSRATIMDEVR